ncbi:acyl-acyl carrier protein thioesterase TE3, chloroplastic-like [Salvia splendens]|nr:acyl-acyl carrier protein thioesterase TE3, chloroplastic-like [Salvia splendens]
MLPHRLPPPSRRCRRLACNSSKGGKGMVRFHAIELQVREYELDQFGIVNNAVYANYCETSMFQVFYMIGFSDETLPTLLESSYKFISPLRKRDRFLIKGRIYECSPARLYFENFIFRLPNKELILENKATAVFLDKSSHPLRLPPFVKSRIDELNKSDKQHLL